MAMAMAAHHHGHLVSYLTVAATTVFLCLSLAPLAAGDPLGQVCGKSGSYTANSPYQANINSLASMLPENASSSQTLFATSHTGSVPDVAYALALCRGDANASACRDCVATAFQDAQQLCAFNKDATIFYDLCLLRYSNENFLSSTTSDGLGAVLIVTDNQNVTAPFQVFDDAVGVLLNATADYAAANSSKRFGTAVEGFQTVDSENQRIYGLVQCTPDMAPADCRSCLGSLIQMAPKYFSGSSSGRCISVRCNYHYELNQFFSGTPLLQLPAPAFPPAAPPMQVPEILTPSASREGRKGRATKIAACSVLLFIILASVLICLKKRKTVKKEKTPALKKIERGKCAVFDLPTLQQATDNFHEKNKLGEGGFGTVFKGRLHDGQDIAVKKLSRSTRKGLNQLQNEVQVLTELQHKNLVRLLGFCLHRDEMMLVYEHVKHGSLDKVLFDSSRSDTLDWDQKYNIILGIAKGILYLHEDSSIRIVHRDLKANNILLDENMNPKIADFGLARLLVGDHTQTKTANVAGTYGYMAPEYAFVGTVSPKIDVFSYGVLVLEIITGRKNDSYDESNKAVNLLTDVWNCWTTKGKALQLVNQSSLDEHSRSKVLRCIQIGLLCVQEHPDDRLNISSVVLMLTRSKVKLQQPRQPAFFFGDSYSSSVSEQHVHRNCRYEGPEVIAEDDFSMNDVTNTDPYPR